jgi:hypothetical protein
MNCHELQVLTATASDEIQIIISSINDLLVLASYSQGAEANNYIALISVCMVRLQGVKDKISSDGLWRQYAYHKSTFD